MSKIKGIIILLLFVHSSCALCVERSDVYQWAVELCGFVSDETGRHPTAHMWIPEECRQVKAVMLAQQNMTEEALFRMDSFRDSLSRMGVALVWVAPAFSDNWAPETGCQAVFENMMTGLAAASGHAEIASAPVIPFGHSAQATFPWNFAAWNPDRTLCIVSFHGDAPRTNLCGYGRANVEWGRTRNIDGIPGLMVEGEYEWWEARVTPALAFRMMYPRSCVSFLCDTGRGHFDCSPRTAAYIALFIRKALQQRLMPDGTLSRLDPKDGWLAPRYSTDLLQNDGDGKGQPTYVEPQTCPAAPYDEYTGDRHDAFWYFDKEMAMLTMARHAESKGKKMQYVGFIYNGSPVPYDAALQGGMAADVVTLDDGVTFNIEAVYTDSTHVRRSDAHGSARPCIEIISGPVIKIDDTTFRIVPYEAGDDNPARSRTIWLAAVADADCDYRGCVQPIKLRINK